MRTCSSQERAGLPSPLAVLPQPSYIEGTDTLRVLTRVTPGILSSLFHRRTLIFSSAFLLLLALFLSALLTQNHAPRSRSLSMLQRLSSLASSLAPTASTTASTPSDNAMSTGETAERRPEYHEPNATPELWRKQLDSLPSLEETGGKIPSIFLAHGQPLLIFPPSVPVSMSSMAAVADIQGPNGSLANFLRDLGPALLSKYSPKAIIVFSAHWETQGTILVSDNGDSNPLLYDFFGFPAPLYETKFESRGDNDLSEQVVTLLEEAGLSALLSSKAEASGNEVEGFRGPGFDHGVFVPFKLMFGSSCPIPIIQVSIDSSLDPQTEYDLGAALAPLRSQGILIISGGLTIHTFRDRSAFSPRTAKEKYKQFEKAIVVAVDVVEPQKRKNALLDLVKHSAFRDAHPRAEHFVPLYVAAGASDNEPGRAKVLMGAHGAKTVVFGV